MPCSRTTRAITRTAPTVLGRDHTSVLHGINQVNWYLSSNPPFAEFIAEFHDYLRAKYEINV